MKLLVFGGNGYIGGECVNFLLNQGHDITLLNREHWPWDSATRLKPRVTNIYCDRYRAEECSDLKKVLSESRFNAVIDFSATDVKRVTPFYELLRNRVDVYVYISSDSVYEVCQKVDTVSNKEEYAVRPSDLELRNELAQSDSYGNGKMEVEEHLLDMQQNTNGIPYVFLRLPDVLGERDTTDRWWKYQMWLEHQQELGVPVLVPKFLESLYTSYVDVLDVANVLQTILTSKTPVRNKIYNVALEKPMKLSNLLTVIKNAADCPEAKIEISEGQFKFPTVEHAPSGALKCGGDFFFPSVTRGPIDTTKIKTELNWHPVADFEKTRAKEIAKFYKSAWKLFPNERKAVGTSLLADLAGKISDECKASFMKILSCEN